MYVLARLYLASGVELGKDEAVYWYWGQHLDASYALLPFATLKLAHALWPYQEWFLRLPSILLGALSAVLLYRLCRNHGLGERPALWAAAAFALSHWTWHTSSYLHPDGFLVPCWLLALCAAQRATGSIDVHPYALMGLAGGGAVLCKYSGAFLVGGLCLWILLSHAHQDRWRLLAVFLLPALAVALPLVYAQLGSGFYLPQTLSSLSRIEGLADPFSRLFFFLVNPLFFVSPFLLYPLYRGLVRAVAQRDLLPLLPALCTIGAFLFFALYRGQIKGNWILPGLLSHWPRSPHQALAGPRRRNHGNAASRRHRQRTQTPGSLQRALRARRLGQILCRAGLARRPEPRAILFVERAALRIRRLDPIRRRFRANTAQAADPPIAARHQHSIQHSVYTGVLRID